MTTLTGWQAIIVLMAGCAVAAAGVVLERGAALVPIGSGIVGAVLALLHASRPTQSRTRASDRRDTAAVGVPITPPPETFPPRR